MDTSDNVLTVYKLDENGRSVWQYPAHVLERGKQCIRVEAFFNRPDMDMGYAVFRQGDRFVEYFYTDRWYNVFAVYDRDGAGLKGWYCNVCRPAEITETAVRCEDLALDVWTTPSGEALVLDEEEFEALLITAIDRQNGRRALAQLLQLSRQGKLPR